MEELEEEIIDLPNTQTQEGVEDLTQTLSQDVTLKPWGRLSALTPTLCSVDLFETIYVVGRAKSICNVVIENPDLPFLLNISKAHFKISEENSVVFLTDLSKNGTYINSKKVGRNKKNIIHSDDIIALGHPNSRAYVFHCNTNDDTNLPEELRRQYFVSKLLGRGAMGEVRFALHKQTCEAFAVKRIIKSKSSSDLHNMNHPLKIKTEIAILRTLAHPFIINMRDVLETEKEVFLILEYMKGGTLNNRIKSLIPLPEDEVKYIFYQIVLAVQYLHSEGITHRDLKPENVLLASDDTYPIVKISDFGLSKIMEEASLMETICGTVNYAAPEILRRSGKYSNRVDVWSLGVVCFYMLCKVLPFLASERVSIVHNILKGNLDWNDKRWGSTSFAAKDLVKKMLNVNPARRITIDEIIKHPWIRQDIRIRCKVEQLLSLGDESDGSDDLYSPPTKKCCSDF